ncbi:MAG: YggS family pyridoxal phosphate-dependent enzyme [Longimicrobiales bacterium]|jgi:pyridoxal phosphate enzyme (YggS family)|nr:YggS family pyridoxal phosphate-dependent enzyme [Longimicrobiales bacterium]|tara:strand:- start:2121 stop:2825 length:705 start_codon:yes stop_codon:yes gene_type:complete
MSQVIYRSRIARAITNILEKIEKAANRSDRNLEDITLIAVTKSHPISAILEILKFEIFDLGENRVPELTTKQESVPDERIRWHMIGHLQSRKVPAVLGSTQLIHSIDSLKLAKRLSNKAVEAGMREQVLLQINASRESTKGGFIVPDMDEDLYSALNLPGLKVAGLMTMAPLTEDGIVMRNTFKSVRELQQKLIDSGLLAGKVLSMGMSNDFEIAIEEGSTMVRLGTALFGRPV